MTLSILQENMSIAAAQSEEESEEIAEKFLDKKLDVDAFLKTYLDKRIVSAKYFFIFFFKFAKRIFILLISSP